MDVWFWGVPYFLKLCYIVKSERGGAEIDFAVSG